MELVPLMWEFEVGGVPSDETKNFLCLTTLSTVDEDKITRVPS